METRPMPIELLKDHSVELSEFSVTSDAEIETILQQLCDGGAFVTLYAPGGHSYTTLLWAVDAERGVVCFSAESSDPQVSALLESEEVVCVGYLDSIKVQFDLQGLVMVRGGKNIALNASWPEVVYRFQRRGAFRVKPLHSATPAVQMRHPGTPDKPLELRILDISLGGIALFLPQDVPMIPAGTRIGRCVVELDADTRLDVSLHVHHVTVLNPESKGVRLGCEMLGLDGSSTRALQRYIDYTQKRRHALGHL